MELLRVHKPWEYPHLEEDLPERVISRTSCGLLGLDHMHKCSCEHHEHISKSLGGYRGLKISSARTKLVKLIVVE